MTYIGDGNSITSQLLFDDAHTHHGLRLTTAKLKSVIYALRGNDALAIKHQHVLPARYFVIRDKKTKDILYSVDKNRYIYRGDIFSSESKNLSQVHMLVTDDEVKVGDYFRGESSIKISGESLGVIKYDEESKENVKHIMQWYNYVQDPEVLNQILKTYSTSLGTNVVDALTKAVDRKSFTEGLVPDVSTPEKIEKFLKNFGGKEHEVCFFYC